MSVIYIVLPLAIVLAFAALLGFIWAARRGQFDDLDTPRVRVLLDDDDAIWWESGHKRRPTRHARDTRGCT